MFLNEERTILLSILTVQSRTVSLICRLTFSHASLDTKLPKLCEHYTCVLCAYN
uniref:Uncharacterized protein n=1 Tax=Anguilla anguilla TaxID=7936 RepID=A0A0E9XMV4_ANGAN